MNNTTDSITDTIIHISETLSDIDFRDLSDKVYANTGIVSFSRNPHTPRFLMVVYNAARTRSGAILDIVRSQGFKANLVGI